MSLHAAHLCSLCSSYYLEIPPTWVLGVRTNNTSRPDIDFLSVNDISPQDKNATLIDYQLPRVQAFINYGHARCCPMKPLFIPAVDCNMCMEHSWHIYSSCCSSDPLRCCFRPYNEGLLPYHHMFSCMQLIVVSTPLAVNNEGLWLQLDRRKVNRELEK